MTGANSTMNIDYGGQQGGILAMAFAAGCIAAFGFLSLVGKFIWSKIGSVKDDRIASLEKQLAKQELDALDDRRRCSEMEVRLVQRIQQLEGFILAMSPGHLRQDFQKALSEQRLDEDAAHGGGNEH